ncbi:MAG: hypothetical protein AB7E05_13275 [Sphingobium sp.]
MAALSLVLLAGGCGGGQGAGNGAEMEMNDLEKVDGTINDAMTDLDGVQSEGTATVDTGSNVAAAGKSAGDGKSAQNVAKPPVEDDTEVVADQ